MARELKGTPLSLVRVDNEVLQAQDPLH
jgi:hypothetical protein